jgi:hypothetical protein
VAYCEWASSGHVMASLMWQRACNDSMATVPDDLEAAMRAYHEAQAAVDTAQSDAKRLVADARAGVVRARERVAAAIVAAARAGVRQRDIVAVTGYSREQVRRICRAAGVEADQD